MLTVSLSQDNTWPMSFWYVPCFMRTQNPEAKTSQGKYSGVISSVGMRVICHTMEQWLGGRDVLIAFRLAASTYRVQR